MDHENKPQKPVKKNRELSTRDGLTEFLLYTAPGGEVKVEIFVHKESVWLTQERMAHLFGVQRPAITKHLQNIFESGELDEQVVSSILEHTTMHGAKEKYETFNKYQKIESDFDRKKVCRTFNYCSKINMQNPLIPWREALYEGVLGIRCKIVVYVY